MEYATLTSTIVCSADCDAEQVITDPVTGRSKGYGFVRFGNESERDRALGEMAGHLISNRPIRVSIATAKKNTVTSPAPAAATGQAFHPCVTSAQGSGDLGVILR